MISYESQLEQYFKNKANSLTFVVGEKGLGKSYFIHNYYKEQKNIIYIKEQVFKSYFLDPIINAIAEFEDNSAITQDYLNMPDAVRKKMLEICKLNDVVICFESFNSYQEDLAEFCISFFQSYLDGNQKYKTAFLLIELDSDISKHDNSLTKKLYSLTTNTNFIKFKKRTEKELTEIISKSFSDKVTIEEKERNYIIKSSFGNISYLFIIINYLKQEGYFYFDGCRWICKSLSNGVLSQTVEDYIRCRYDRLDDELKRVLQKSSLLGLEFDSVQLKNTFDLVKAEEELSKIEKISALIRKNDICNNNKYYFETEEVCNNIQNLIPNDEKKIWNKLLAEYYEVQFNKYSPNLLKRLENCCRLAVYYKNCDYIEKSMLFYFRAIRYSVYLLDFKHALELITSFKEIRQTCIKSKHAHSEISKWEAYCYHALGKYDDAVNIYAKLLHDVTYTKIEKMEIEYLYADSLYFIGKVNRALNILLSLKDQLQLNHNDKLLFKVLSELATIYGFYRNYGSAREYFSYSVNQCHDAGLEHEYYIQLRKASMFWELKLTVPLMEQAAVFFEKKNDVQELAKTYHNLGTDLLYLGKEKQAISYLNQAVEEFQKYGSDEIHYTYNCIGVYYAAYKQDYEKAIEYFRKALSFDPVLFSTMVLNINIASCFKILHEDEANNRYLNLALEYQNAWAMKCHPTRCIFLLIREFAQNLMGN